MLWMSNVFLSPTMITHLCLIINSPTNLLYIFCIFQSCSEDVYIHYVWPALTMGTTQDFSSIFSLQIGRIEWRRKTMTKGRIMIMKFLGTWFHFCKKNTCIMTYLIKPYNYNPVLQISTSVSIWFKTWKKFLVSHFFGCYSTFIPFVRASHVCCFLQHWYHRVGRLYK